MGTLCCGCGALCCIRNSKPLCIEITGIIVNIIIIGLLSWGLAKIPFDDIPSRGKTWYIILFVVQIVLFVILLIEVVLRCLKLINTKYCANCTGKIMFIFSIILTVAGIVLSVLSLVFIDKDMLDQEDLINKLKEETEDDDDDFDLEFEFSNGEYAAAFVPTVATFSFDLMVYLCCSIYLLLIICHKTDLSYKLYKEMQDMKEIQANNTLGAQAINVNNPPQNLVLKGYDINGQPLYGVADPNVPPSQVGTEFNQALGNINQENPDLNQVNPGVNPYPNNNNNVNN